MIGTWELSTEPRAPRAVDAGLTPVRRSGRTVQEGLVIGPPIELRKGDVLYDEGSTAEVPYLVLGGVLRVLVPTLLGKQRLADLAGVGDVLGTAAFDGPEHGETVVAADDARVARIDVAETLARVSGRDALSSALVKQLTRSRELADDLGLPMGARICRILARLADRLGDLVKREAAGGNLARMEWRHLPFSLTHDDVALLAGCARVTATRILGELKAANMLDGHRGNYAMAPRALELAADRYVYEVL